jgi:hypothetical protein
VPGWVTSLEHCVLDVQSHQIASSVTGLVCLRRKAENVNRISHGQVVPGITGLRSIGCMFGAFCGSMVWKHWAVRIPAGLGQALEVISLIDCIAVGVDRMQRSFDPGRGRWKLGSGSN